MTSVRILRAVKERGPLGAFEQFFKLRTFKFGRLVGVDSLGNKYYENTEEYKHGMHRWFEPAGFRGWFDCDVSEISPEWHGWLHQVTDDPPTETTVGSVYKNKPEMGVRHSDAPYDRNLGGVRTPHVPNQTQRRARGFGLGNSIKGPLAIKANEECYYTQPGWPLDPRHRRPRKPVGWSLTDTPATLAARREREIGAGTVKALAAIQDEILNGGPPAVASQIAEAEIMHPTVRSGAAARVLSLRDEEAIRTDMVVNEGIIAQYSGYRGFKDASNAVENAKARLLELHSELDELKAAQAEAHASD